MREYMIRWRQIRQLAFKALTLTPLAIALRLNVPESADSGT